MTGSDGRKRPDGKRGEGAERPDTPLTWRLWGQARPFPVAVVQVNGELGDERRTAPLRAAPRIHCRAQHTARRAADVTIKFVAIREAQVEFVLLRSEGKSDIAVCVARKWSTITVPVTDVGSQEPTEAPGTDMDRGQNVLCRTQHIGRFVA